MENSIGSRVVSVVKELSSSDLGEGVLDASIGVDFALTSLDKMTLFIALEDEFNQTIPQEEVEDIKTVREIIEFIETKIA